MKIWQSRDGSALYTDPIASGVDDARACEARFEFTDLGWLGITQGIPRHAAIAHVLLTPIQTQALLQFVHEALEREGR